MPPEIRVIGVEGMPEAVTGDDLAAQIMDACQNQGRQIGHIVEGPTAIMLRIEDANPFSQVRTDKFDWQLEVGVITDHNRSFKVASKRIHQ